MPLSFTWPTILPMIAVAILFAIGCSSGPAPPAPASKLAPSQMCRRLRRPLPLSHPNHRLSESPPHPSTAAVVFPEDEGSHDTPVEWWYFNGMLRDEAGGEYSYHFVTFQLGRDQRRYTSPVAGDLGDHRSGAHYDAETLALAQPEAPGWTSRPAVGSCTVDLTATICASSSGGASGPVDLELSAVFQREPVLHGGNGLVDMGPEAGSTYYYSRTRLAVTGWIEDTGGRREVRGPGWMDHQWGDIARRDIGWDWSSIQLDDGSDLMVAVICIRTAPTSGGARHLPGARW